MKGREHQNYRKLVLERDKGICALCGIDAVRLEKVIDRVITKSAFMQLSWMGYLARRYPWALTVNREYWPSIPFKLARPSLWEADHILPVSENGAGRGLENFRTLCIACHGMVTAGLRRRSAKSERARKKHMAHLEKIHARRQVQDRVPEP